MSREPNQNLLMCRTSSEEEQRRAGRRSAGSPVLLAFSRVAVEGPQL